MAELNGSSRGCSLSASLLIAGCGAVQSTPRNGARHAAIRSSELARRPRWCPWTSAKTLAHLLRHPLQTHRVARNYSPIRQTTRLSRKSIASLRRIETRRPHFTSPSLHHVTRLAEQERMTGITEDPAKIAVYFAGTDISRP